MKGGDFGNGRFFGQGEPVFRVGGVDSIGKIAAGENFLRSVEADVMHGVNGNAEFLAEGDYGLFGDFAEGIGIFLEVERISLGFANEGSELVNGVALANDQSAAESAQVGIERGEGLAEELLAVRAGPVVLLFPIRYDIQRQNRVAIKRRGFENLMIGYA